MTLSDIKTKARDLVNATVTTYPDANLLIDINLWYQKVATMILEAQDDSDFDDSNNTTYPQETTVLVDLQRDYPITSALNILQIKRLDISYDGVTWNRARPLDDGAIKQGLPPVTGYTSMDATVDGRFTKSDPRFDYKYGSIWIYPRAQTGDAAAGASMVAEFSRAVVPFTASDLSTGVLSPGFDLPFHPMLAYGPAMEFATKRQLPQLQKIVNELQDYEARLKRAYGNKDKDIKWTLTPYDIPEDIYNR